MSLKVVVFAAFVAVAKAGIIAPAPLVAAPLLKTAAIATPIAAAPVLRTAHIAAAPLLKTAPIVAAPLAKAITIADADYDPNPQYSYAYDIQDVLTGDSKNHYETRNGDVVQGSYSLVDPDGTRRTVEYTVDPISGFNAVVHKEPLAVKTIAAAPIVTPVAKIATPLVHGKVIY